MEKLERRQLELEADAIEEAKNRIQKAAARGPLRLVKEATDPLAQAIRERQEAVEDGARWPYGVALLAIDAEKLALLTQGEKDILAWRNAIDRTLVKRPTMTTPYGVTPKGIIEQIREAIRERYPERFDAPWMAPKFLSERLTEAIGEVVVQASKITEWLRHLATLLGCEGKPISWTLPTGFRVTNDYRKKEEHRVDTALLTLQTLRHKEGAAIDLEEQANGIVANLVQSLDAAHMMFVVRELHRRGLRHFAVVHDSYAVHACDVDTMNEVLRGEFIRIYTDFTLAKLYEDLKRQAPGIEIPPPPALGTLELAAVRESAYFFS